MPDSAFTNSTYLEMFKAIVAGTENQERYSFLVTELSVEALPLPSEEKDYGVFVDGCFNRLLIKDYERQILQIKSQLARGEGNSDALFEELLGLEMLKKGLKGA